MALGGCLDSRIPVNPLMNEIIILVLEEKMKQKIKRPISVENFIARLPKTRHHIN